MSSSFVDIVEVGGGKTWAYPFILFTSYYVVVKDKHLDILLRCI